MFKRSCENPNRFYLCIFGKRFIFDGCSYVGWYDPNLDKVL